MVTLKYDISKTRVMGMATRKIVKGLGVMIRDS